MTDSVPSDHVAPDPSLSPPAPGAQAAPAPRRSRSARTWIIVAVVAVVVVVGAVGAVVLVADSAAIHDGPGTATFTWTPVHQSFSSGSTVPPPQPFTASINGHSVTGTATTILPTSADAAVRQPPRPSRCRRSATPVTSPASPSRLSCRSGSRGWRRRRPHRPTSGSPWSAPTATCRWPPSSRLRPTVLRAPVRPTSPGTSATGRSAPTSPLHRDLDHPVGHRALRGQRLSAGGRRRVPRTGTPGPTTARRTGF